jgi:hypothetical protein
MIKFYRKGNLIQIRFLLDFVFGDTLISYERTNHHDITEILLKVALSTINQTKPTKLYIYIISIFNDFFPVIGRSRCGEKLKKIIEICIIWWAWFGLWCLMPLSTIFQIYRGG